MKEGFSDVPKVPLKDKRKTAFCCIGNEIFDVFLPIMGADCFAVYGYFRRIEFTNRKLIHTIRGITESTEIGSTTVSRSLEILEHLGLIKLFRFGGSRDSECQLVDSTGLAFRLGAKYHRQTLSFSLPPTVAERLKAEVAAIRERQQGKSSPEAPRGTPHACGNLPFRVSQRNASVSPAIRKRSARETQTEFHLLLEERRIEEAPSPTPSHNDEAQKAKDSPDEDEPESLLLWARNPFTGVMNDMRDHLLDTKKPPAPHLTNGADDWKEFELGSLAVEAAAWCGEVLTLALSASDSAEAQRGLGKYHRKWDASLRKWYGCEVRVELRPG